MFEEIPGNEPIKRFFTSALARGLVGNSYLFSGEQGCYKERFAEEIGKALVGGPSDFHELRPEGKSAAHSIAALRAFKEQVYLAPQEGGWKVFVIYEADRMLPTSSNALLKVFEEPPENNAIFLLTAHPEKMLPTILSRCRKVRFQPVEKRDLSADPLLAPVIELFASGSDSYHAIQRATSAVSETLEKRKEEFAEEAKQMIATLSEEQLTAKLRDQMEKEVTGFVAMRTRDEVAHFFEGIYSWFRDRLLIKCGGDSVLLFYPAYKEEQRALPLEHVSAALQQARLEVERFGSFPNSLETALFKLLL